MSGDNISDLRQEVPGKVARFLLKNYSATVADFLVVW